MTRVEPFPAGGDLYTIEALSIRYQVGRKRLWNILSEHRDKFHRYKRHGRLLITEDEVRLLDLLFPVKSNRVPL